MVEAAGVGEEEAVERQAGQAGEAVVAVVPPAPAPAQEQASEVLVAAVLLVVQAAEAGSGWGLRAWLEVQPRAGRTRREA